MRRLDFILLGLILCFACGSDKEKRWFDAGDWKQGISQELANEVDIKVFYEQFHKNPELWKKAFEYLKNDLTVVEIGSYDLGGGMKANVQEYDTKAPENAIWEAHRKFIDLQYIIDGKEKMGYKPLSQSTSTVDYNPENDAWFFDVKDGRYETATPANFFLFFPEDVHQPGLQVENPEHVKKVVIKIPVAE
ncbi:MAG: YhcH/YjgK/YiaL family protein [Tannerella sp.]|jgi:YhcH/YjgK/YiaL family protein|nr:YhcH/YjgK/YiaL family protein [Tannerella sp.]